MNLRKGLTKNRKFNLPDGTSIKVPFMTTNENQIIHSFKDFKEYVCVGSFQIPKFKISFGFKASEALKQGRLDLPFSNNAEHDGLVIDQPYDKKIKVSKVFHRSFIKVNEQGMEASAVTTVFVSMIEQEALELEPTIDFDAEHPFMFMVRNGKSGTLLFLGHVVLEENKIFHFHPGNDLLSFSCEEIFLVLHHHYSTTL
ncbi:hypothetical protein GIB67_029678 [Kingdonia uniflora]|uniref:Serpin domain-containing protein n=1 Tax=Kingdonia uniflora TaxID=39325 RepID=A0A7J7LLR4_9MAGN|nr:hypothetical protein GIB67_029678 [Kingdonia uniflora]